MNYAPQSTNESILVPAGTYQALAAQFYYCADTLETERKQIFSKSWQFVEHQTGLANAGG